MTPAFIRHSLLPSFSRPGPFIKDFARFAGFFPGPGFIGDDVRRL